LPIRQIKLVSYRRKGRLLYTCAVNAVLNSGVLLDKKGYFLIAALPNLDYTAEKLFSLRRFSNGRTGDGENIRVARD
jgi:hypothetical protein